MPDSLKNHNPTKPPVEKVVGIERNAEQRNQWVVPPRQQKQWNHVDNRHDTRPVSDGRAKISRRKGPVNTEGAPEHIGGKVQEQEYKLEAGWQCANVDGARDLHLLIVSLTKERRPQHMLLEEGVPFAARDSKESLAIRGDRDP